MDNSPTISPQAGTISRRAWLRWLLLTGVSIVSMAVLLPIVNSTQMNDKTWFIAPVLWLLLAVPATVGVYGHSFRNPAGLGADADLHAAEEYLRGATSVWSVLTAGVVLSLVACLLAGSASPGIWPGALMLMLLMLARPTSSTPQA